MLYYVFVFRQKLVSSFSSKTIFAKNRPDKNRATYLKFSNERIKRFYKSLGFFSESITRLFSAKAREHTELTKYTIRKIIEVDF